MRLWVVALSVAVIAAGAVAGFCLFGDDDDSESVSLNAGYKASVTYSDEGATVTVTPASSGSHSWIIGSESLTSTGKDAVSVTVPVSDSSCLISHTVTSGGVTRSMTSTVSVSGVKTVTLEWMDSSGTEQSVSVNVDWTTWHNLRTRSDMGTLEEIAVSDDTIITDLAEQLSSLWSDLSNDQLAAELLRFVQLAFSYQEDIQSTGLAEWYKTPYETVYDGGGDCEDTSLLYAMLGEALGLHTGLITMDGHVAAAVWLEEWTESWDGVSVATAYGTVYYYAETATNQVIALGRDVDSHMEGFRTLICLDSWVPEDESEEETSTEDPAEGGEPSEEGSDNGDGEIATEESTDDGQSTERTDGGQ